MGLSNLAISRPYTVAVGFLLAVLVGGFSLTRLPIDLMPDISYPTLTVSVEYPGVGPEEIETLLTEPIEEAVSAVQGIEAVTSTSVEGLSQVRLSFHWGTDLEVATDDVRARLDRVRNRFPDEASPPSIFKFDAAAFPVVFLGVSGDLPPLELKRIAEDEIKHRLERLPGVAAAEVRGGLQREIRVEADRQKLAALGLTLEQVAAALSRENLNVAAGEFRQDKQELGLRVQGVFTDVGAIGEATITSKLGQPVRIRDVATVVDSHQDITSVVTIDGRSSLQVQVRKQSGANTVQVADAVVRAVAEINRDVRGVDVSVINDTSRFIRRSIDHITSDLLIGSALAALVLLFFLRHLRSTLIVTTAIPISVIATFALLYFRDFSLNTMSLGGLALGIGRLVDDSIVVIENIYRHRQMGKDPRAAALDGTKQVSLAIVASTATTLAVFVPLIFLSGMTGVMFQQLSLVVVFALSCSLVVAQGLIPLLAARFLGDDHAEPQLPPLRRLYRSTGTFLNRLDDAYRRSLRWALAHARTVVVIAVVAVLSSVALLPLLGSEYMPKADEGEVRVNAEMATGSTLAAMQERFQELEAITRQEVPEAMLMLAEIGGGGFRSSGANTGSLRLILTPANERRRSSETIANALRPKLSGIAGVTARVSAAGGMPIRMGGGGQESGRIGVQIRGFDREIGRRLTDEVKTAMSQTAGIADVRASRESGRPEAVVRVDRARAAAMGISVTQVARALEMAVLGRRATAFRVGGEEYSVVVRLPEAQRQNLDQALDVAVATSSGALIPIRDVVTVVNGEGPSTIERENQERVINVSGELAGADLGTTVRRLQDQLRTITTPAGFALVVTGDFEEQQKSFNELLTALGMALLLVFLVMVAQFESLSAPFVIFFSVPTCITGVVLALLLTGTTLNVQSFIGVIVLVGIAVSNGIVMVDFMDQLRQGEGVDLETTVYEGALARLRPVLMTTATTVLAMTPMALGLGEGGELQSPMARVVIGGLISSTLITLYLVPIVYRWLNGILDRRAKRAQTVAAAKAPG